jgi:hypothetical protein
MQLSELRSGSLERLRIDAEAALLAAQRFSAQLDDDAAITQVRLGSLHGLSLLPGGPHCNAHEFDGRASRL